MGGIVQLLGNQIWYSSYQNNKNSQRALISQIFGSNSYNYYTESLQFKRIIIYVTKFCTDH